MHFWWEAKFLTIIIHTNSNFVLIEAKSTNKWRKKKVFRSVCEQMTYKRHTLSLEELIRSFPFYRGGKKASILPKVIQPISLSRVKIKGLCCPNPKVLLLLHQGSRLGHVIMFQGKSPLLSVFVSPGRAVRGKRWQPHRVTVPTYF